MAYALFCAGGGCPTGAVLDHVMMLNRTVRDLEALCHVKARPKVSTGALPPVIRTPLLTAALKRSKAVERAHQDTLE